MRKSRKNDIINTANNIIKTYGYSNLSFAQISQIMGVTRANIHHYFSKKEDLGNACIDTLCIDITNLMNNIINDDIDAFNKINQYFTIYKANRDEIESCPVAKLVNEYEILPKSMQDKMKTLCEIEINSLTQIIDRGKENGTFNIDNHVSSELKARTIVTLLKGAVSYTKVFNNFNDLTNFVVSDLRIK